MDQKFIVVSNCEYLLNDPVYNKLIFRKCLFPIGTDGGFIGKQARIVVKLKKPEGDMVADDSTTIEHIKDVYCLKTQKATFDVIKEHLECSDYVFIVEEGSADNATVILRFHLPHEKIFERLESKDPTLRLLSYDLPPLHFTVIDSPNIRRAVYSFLSKQDREMFSLRAQRFLRTPHILTSLFSHVMSLESKDHINFINILKVISDRLREFLKPRIRRVEKNHHELWARFYGESVSFVDGGMSRIVSLPGTEPMGIRVGIYTVIPGEADLERRESWNLHSYVIGDVVSDKSIIDSDDFYQTDSKRLQEAARYILEPWTALEYLDHSEEKPKVVFLHGPLQNAFETYDERDPYYIPGINPEFLSANGVTREVVEDLIEHIPMDTKGNVLWNACIPIYAYIMKRIFQSSVPIMGVVERAKSTILTTAMLDLLVQEGVIPASTKRQLRNEIKRYEIDDEFLFGCVLDEGEYIEPVKIIKNVRRRAHDRWQLVIDQFPAPISTMIKCSENNFPYRVEINSSDGGTTASDIMSLLYHTSLLLPNYAFPVGIDIADKYAKIPDWLSKGISARLTATVLNKVLQTGNDRLLRQVRQLLARSPRDFFFRPKA